MIKSILIPLKIQSESVTLDGDRFIRDTQINIIQIHVDALKNFTKCHIAVNVDSRIILYSQAVKRPRPNIKFSIAPNKNIIYSP